MANSRVIFVNYLAAMLWRVQALRASSIKNTGIGMIAKKIQSLACKTVVLNSPWKNGTTVKHDQQ
jgi:hypothetical protein